VDHKTPVARKKEPPRASESAPLSTAEELDTTPPSREQGEKASEILQEILRRMGMESAITLEQHADELSAHTDWKDSGALIGRNGQTLDALEYVLSRIITRSDDVETHIVLDAEGYRERRRKTWRIWRYDSANGRSDAKDR
jgi:spoIIIJ-associated protein